MRAFIRYFTDYLRNCSRPALILTVLLIAALVTANYTIGIERRIQLLPWYAALAAFFGFFLLLLALIWGLQYEWAYKDKNLVTTPAVARGKIKLVTTVAPSGYFKPPMILLLVVAAFFFSLKMIHWDLASLLPSTVRYPWDRYTLLLIQLPLKLLLLFALLVACRKFGLLEGDSFGTSIGLTTKNFNALPYFGLLLALLPLIAIASTQHDFLQVYPKVRNLDFINGYAHPSWPWKLLYEISYGLDFLGIELFFRGLLVIGLLRFVGTDAILPMAAFYCTIHFGKPLAECISSFFGGIILGVLAARTRTILGGLIVHLGLAWLMELGGLIGNGLLHF